jgi:hypothetical protein
MAYTVQEGLEAFGTEACFFAMPYTNILTRDRFTKTGSGQTIGKKTKTRFFCRRGAENDQIIRAGDHGRRGQTAD